jgi:hypothetical protein
MSLKQEIETWVAALGRYDNNEFEDALGEFDKISDTSKILFNMGVIHATLGEHEQAASLSFSFPALFLSLLDRHREEK